ncbi:serine hydrolase [Rapidithrix thailandica]|uniref:Serine hydrolase n=1 Tax=Rapidithrix thailandica TaxID=413964 RepID=A0AAW9S7F3_9BACT
MEYPSIAENLIYQRKRKGYTQEELAGKSKVTIRTIQRIEKGEVKPHLQTVKLLAAALAIEVEDLMILKKSQAETSQEKWLLLMHSAPVLGGILPLCNILFPLFLWLHKRKHNKVYDMHGRAIVNFQMTMSILFLLSFIALVTLEGYGFFLFIAVIPYTLTVILINIVTAVHSQKCYYPLSIPFLRTRKPSAFKKLGAIIISFCALFSSACHPEPSPNITRLDGSLITTDSLTSKIKQLIRDAGVHGLGVTVFENSHITYQKTFGYKDYKKQSLLSDSTNLYGASLSKAVFSVLVMKLVEEKVIDLDTPLETYLPKKIYEYQPLTRWHDDYSGLAQDTLYSKITARMCLSHTSGFPNWRWFEPDHQLRVKFEPGTRYSYSGEGFVYLQVVLEKVLGHSLEKLAQQKIFKPLGMNRSSYQWQEAFEGDYAAGHTTTGVLYPKDTDNEPRSGSTLETTVEDYSKFMEAVLQRKILTKESWAELFTPQIKLHSLKQFGPLSNTDTTLYQDLLLGYGLGWGLLNSPFGFGAFKEGHGDGFQHYSILFPEAGKGILIMTNSDNGESIFKELLSVAIRDVYTPWQWQNYIPYNHNFHSDKI